MTILALSGSRRPESSNGLMLRFLADHAPEGVCVSVYPDLGDLPHFMPGAEPPPAVAAFRERIRAAAAVLICTPEYAHGVPGVLKNALDWTVSSADLYEKPVALITASTQGQHAHESLLETLRVLTARPVPGATLLVPFIRSRIGADDLIDQKLQQQLTDALGALVRTVRS